MFSVQLLKCVFTRYIIVLVKLKKPKPYYDENLYLYKDVRHELLTYENYQKTLIK